MAAPGDSSNSARRDTRTFSLHDASRASRSTRASTKESPWHSRAKMSSLRTCWGMEAMALMYAMSAMPRDKKSGVW